MASADGHASQLPMSVTGYILAGGKSRRFGSDKARAELDGLPLLARVAKILSHNCDKVFAVASEADQYADINVASIGDLHPGGGPIAGLETALSHQLEHRGPGWIILASCDLAGLKVGWTRAVLKRAAELDSPVAAIAFWNEFWQPFPAAYHTRLLPLTKTLLDDGNASFQALLSLCGKNALALPLPNDWPATPQINTPADLAAFKSGED